MNGKARRAIGKTATYVTLVIIILVLNLPFLSMLGTALKPSKDAMTVELFPSNPTFENFVNIFTNTNFPRYLLNRRDRSDGSLYCVCGHSGICHREKKHFLFQKLRGNSSAFADVPDDTASSALVLDF